MTGKIPPKKLLVLALLLIIAFALVPKISFAQNVIPPPTFGRGIIPPPQQTPITPPPSANQTLVNPPPSVSPPPAAAPTANTNPQDLPPNPIACGLTDPGNWPACGLYWIIRAIHWILGLIIALGAVLVGFGLDLARDLVNQKMVQAGFAVSLSIANLGFVLAIIIVALATILRSQSYGIKQLLWKLIVAAVLVNFGLVIAGTILGFSDTMTGYFTTPFGYKSPGESGQFVNKLTTALAPNVFMIPPAETKSEAQKRYDNCVGSCASVLTGGWTPACAFTINACGSRARQENYEPGNAWDEFAQLFLAMVFVIIADFIIALTLMALAIMLIIRFVTLGILLIIMPLAWLLWIFPQYSSHFKLWWSAFLKWAFFPTIVTFFLFLAVETVNTAGSSNTGSSGGQPVVTSPVAGVAADAIAIQTKQPSFTKNLLNLIMVAGLSIGGLFAANKMGIAGASVAMGAAQSVGRGIKNYAGKQAKKAGSYGLRTEAGRKLTGGLQNAGMDSNRLVRGLLRPVRQLGTAVAKRRESTEGAVRKKQIKLGKLSYEEQAKRVGSEDNAGRLAIMENLTRAKKRGDANAGAAFDSLPQNIKDRMPRLQTLYGRGEKEYFESGAGVKTSMEAMDEEIKNREEKGENVDDIKKPHEDFKDAEEKKEAAKNKQNEGDNSEKIVKTIREEEERSRRALERIKEAVERRQDRGENVDVFQSAIDEFELSQKEERATRGASNKGKTSEEKTPKIIVEESIGEGKIETVHFGNENQKEEEG